MRKPNKSSQPCPPPADAPADYRRKLRRGITRLKATLQQRYEDIFPDGRSWIERAGVEPILPELSGGGFALFGVTRADQDGDVLLAQLAGCLEPNAFIGSGDQCDFLVVLHIG